MIRQPTSDTLQLTGDEKRRLSGMLRTTWFDSVNSSQRPQLRHGASDEEQRLYFLWTQPGPLMQFDRQLSRRAVSESSTGAQLEKRQILKFISPALEKRLAKTELEYASAKGNRTVDSIAKTVFISRPQGDGYQFVVTDQRY